MQHIGLPVLGRVCNTHGLRFYGNASFTFQFHLVEHLLFHLPR